ncbi:unnamed protein product [Trichobilharzia szidati]|nr:unnamed protein product [Trichobilharzia szidati]
MFSGIDFLLCSSYAIIFDITRNSTKIPGKSTPANLTKLPVKKPRFTHKPKPTTRQVRIAPYPGKSISPHNRGVHKPHKNHSGVAIKVGIPMNYRGGSKLVSDNSSLTEVDKPVVERIKNFTRSRRERRKLLFA